MRYNIYRSFIVAIITFSSLARSYGQSLPVGTPLLEDAYRRGQLLGQVDLSSSFTSRPFYPYLKLDGAYRLNNPSLTDALATTFRFNSTQNLKGNFNFKLLPLTWAQQINTKNPYGINDGAMIHANGYQTLFSGGFFAQYSFLSVQFQPEFVFAQNKPYDGFPDEHPDEVWKIYNNRFLRMIDQPERFGDERHQKAYWGQSSIRLTFGPMSFGLSTENLWWGPGMNNALLLTNNAPGFKHLTLNTVRPINTFIGSFEGQLVGGRLEQSGFPGVDTLRLSNSMALAYKPKPDDWRYL
jgi:hypothetical protein